MTANLVQAEKAPCTRACPAGVNVQAYVGLIAQGKFREALDVVRDALPFPAICGRVCPAFCEAECSRGKNNEGAVSIRALKRFVADAEEKSGKFAWSVPKATRKEKIAVVGSGPAGLTAALELRKMGYGVTVFEAEDKLGGMLNWSLPIFRLPRKIADAEIDAIAKVLDVKKKVRIGKDKTIPDLLKDFAAVVIAVGAHNAMKLGVKGEDARGIMDALKYLTMKKKPKARKVIVLGGGNTAVDATRAAVRSGAEEVRIVYRRSRREMPAGADEVEHAVEEGVILQTLVAPVHVLVKKDTAVGMRCIRTKLGEPDSSGRRRPVPIEGSEFDVDADLIIAAIGQQPSPDIYKKADDLAGRSNRAAVDWDTLQTKNPKVFAAGDAVLGPATIVQAVGQARQVAKSVDQFLGSGKVKKDKDESYTSIMQVEAPQVAFRERLKLRMLPSEERRANDEEVELPMEEAAARAEANRCLRCGACSECTICSSVCVWRLASVDPDDPVP
ncbi:MAG: FAD-dependent oxidoreductase, partial [Planctomycetota bacterium]